MVVGIRSVPKVLFHLVAKLKTAIAGRCATFQIKIGFIEKKSGTTLYRRKEGCIRHSSMIPSSAKKSLARNLMLTSEIGIHTGRLRKESI